MAETVSLYEERYMVIQCEKCQTKFRLDDSRVTEKGVRVRCTKCKYVFTVKKDMPEERPEIARAGFVPPLIRAGIAETAPSVEQHCDVPAGAAEPTAAAAPFLQDTVPPSPADGGFDFSDFVFGSEQLPGEEQSTDPFHRVTSSAAGTESETNSVDFSEWEREATPPQDPAPFLFNLPDEREGAFTAPTPEAVFGQTEEITIPPVAPPVFTEPPPAVSEPIVAPAVAGEVNLSPAGAFSPGGDAVLPPPVIATRRKQSSLFGILLATIAVVVLLVAGYFGYTTFYAQKELPAVEVGKISVRGVTAAFVKNSVAGELLVISGEAVNEYSRARAALQVKATVFGGAGQSVAGKMAYCGNPLTAEQLQSLPLEKIEAAMANQFGDSLANMGVPPGKAIRFVVVLAAVPPDAKDFSVQSAGSTVATGK